MPQVILREEIPAGYQVKITTWENDGDDYSTQVFSGLSDYDVMFYLNIAEQFRSKNGPKRGMGNQEVDEDALIELISEVLEINPNISPAIRQNWQDAANPENEGAAYDAIKDVLGEPVGYDGNFCRVFEKIEVLWFRETVPAVVAEAVESFAHDATKNFVV